MYIYCISDGKDLCKFGFSNNPEKRLEDTTNWKILTNFNYY